MESKLYQTTRIWCETHQQLRLVAALTGKSMVEALDRLVKAELARLEAERARKSQDVAKQAKYNHRAVFSEDWKGECFT
jgi:hypothetical protein